jgi:transposase-like protein
MPEQRRKFSPQFKAEAVQMVLETGRPIAEVARDLGINDGTLGNSGLVQSREDPGGTAGLLVGHAAVRASKTSAGR